jgi:hypothetical protein
MRVPQSVADEEMLENDVNYGIADCRRRLRSQRSTLRALYHPPKQNSDELSLLPATAQLEEREEAVIT